MAKRAPKGPTVDQHYARLDNLAAGGIAPVTVVSGPQEFFRQEAVNAIAAAAKAAHPQLDTVSFQGPASASEARLPIATILAELSSQSLFASQKLVLVRRAQLFLFPNKAEEDSPDNQTGEAKTSAKKKVTPEEAFSAYLDSPAPGMFLVIECDSLNKTRTIGKALTAKAALIECPELRWESEIVAWLRLAARRRCGKTLTPDAASLLAASWGAQPGSLAQELEKLSIYAGETQQIDGAAVRAFMGETLAFTIFELTNAIESRDPKLAIRTARRILEQGLTDSKGKQVDAVGSAHMALGALQKCLGNLWTAQDIISRGGGEMELEEKFGPRGRFLAQAGGRYSQAELKNAFAALADGLASAHATGGDLALMFERTVLAICNGAQK